MFFSSFLDMEVDTNQRHLSMSSQTSQESNESDSLVNLLKSKGLTDAAINEFKSKLSSQEIDTISSSFRQRQASNQNKKPPQPIQNVQYLANFSNEYHYLNVFCRNQASDMNKFEMIQILYPLFVAGYTQMLQSGLEKAAAQFFEIFSPNFSNSYSDAMNELSALTRADHVQNSHFINDFKSRGFKLKISRESFAELQNYLTRNAKQFVLISRLLKDYKLIQIEELDMTRPRGVVTMGSPASGNRAPFSKNVKIHFGIIRYVEDTVLAEDLDSEDENLPDKMKNDKKRRGNTKKTRKEIIARSQKTDPNAPPRDRIPLYETIPNDKKEHINMLKDQIKRVPLTHSATQMVKKPSALQYSILNNGAEISANAISDNSSLYAHSHLGGNVVRVRTLDQYPLTKLKPSFELANVNPASENAYNQILEPDSPDQHDLIGHSGKVLCIAFSSAFGSVSGSIEFIITGSEDSTVRLWSLLTFTCLVIYHIGPLHSFPVWSVDFAPFGRYFTVGGGDRIVRVYGTESTNPLRVCVGHESDVNVVRFHPNSNYIASGSDDRTIRIWDMVDGQQVRIFMAYCQGQVMRFYFKIF